MSDSLIARTVELTGRDGAAVEAYLAQPQDPGQRGGVIVIHHMPGYDQATKEITRRFAELGYDALCPNLFSREAPGAAPDDASAAVRAAGGVPDERAVGDIAAAMNVLREASTSNGKVGVIGYCSGGRQSVLVACHLPLHAAVDCYGAYVTGTPPAGSILRSNLVGLLPQLQAPLLGLFGKEDAHPSPAEVEELDQILDTHGKVHQFHSYDDAGHAFFAVDRPSYRVAAATDGWRRIADFFQTYLGG